MESDMLKRVNRQSIASFVMFGAGSLEFEDGSFDERLRDGERAVSEYLDKLRLTGDERDELNSREGSLLDLYFEQGVKIGALLYRELTQ